MARLLAECRTLTRVFGGVKGGGEGVVADHNLRAGLVCGGDAAVE